MTGPPFWRSRITMRDDSLPHQIRLFFLGSQQGWIAVSCCCLKQNGGSYLPLDKRKRWDDPDEPMRIWRKHMGEVQEATAPQRELALCLR